MRDRNLATTAQREHLGKALFDNAAKSMVLTGDEAQMAINCGTILNWVAGSLEAELSALLRPGHACLTVPALPSGAVPVELGDRRPFRWDGDELEAEEQVARQVAWLQPAMRSLLGREVTFSTRVTPYLGSNGREWPTLVLPDLTALTRLPVSPNPYHQFIGGSTAYGLLVSYLCAAIELNGIHKVQEKWGRRAEIRPVPAVAQQWAKVFPRPYADGRVEVMFQECRFHPAVTFKVGDGAPHNVPSTDAMNLAAVNGLVPGGILALAAALVAWPQLADQMRGNTLDARLAGDEVYDDRQPGEALATQYLITNGGGMHLHTTGHGEGIRCGTFLIDPGLLD